MPTWLKVVLWIIGIILGLNILGIAIGLIAWVIELRQESLKLSQGQPT